MNNLIYLFIGFMMGIIVSIACKFICSRNNSRRNRGNIIVPRRTVVITDRNLFDTNSDNYSISVESESKEESKEEQHIRVVEEV